MNLFLREIQLSSRTELHPVYILHPHTGKYRKIRCENMFIRIIAQSFVKSGELRIIQNNHIFINHVQIDRLH